MSWQQQATAHLLQSKRRGFTWEKAYILAANTIRVPEKDGAAANLFEQDDTQAAFYWRVAERAYKNEIGPVGSGNGPGIRWWTTELAQALDDLPAAA